MWPDGICRVTDTHYTKTIQYQDINYQLSQNEDKTAIFEAWCDFLNYFDSSVKFQLSFVNLSASKDTFAKSINIPPQGDEFDSIRAEYAAMLQNQLARGNNGLIKTKYLTFGIDADNFRSAKPRLERIETDILNNFKRLGVSAEPLNGHDRLRVLHDILRMDEMEPFRFSWDWLAPSGLSTKDFIAPSSFEFRTGKQFTMGKKLGAVSFVQILAPELNDRMLADFLDMESSIVVNLHVQSVDQVNAIKTVKRKITDLDKSKIEEQKKAVRAGYDMDIIPSDLATYGAEAKKLLQDLQSRNERMFLLTFLIMNTADTQRQLGNNIFQASSIAQKYNCQLTRLDFQQEEGLMSSLPLGLNQIEIQRGLTTSSVAIFVPFTTQELFQSGREALYYGINALSNNLIMVDRKLLKNPNGLILGTPGCLHGDTRILLENGTAISIAELVKYGIDTVSVKACDEETGKIINTIARDIRIEKYVDKVWKLYFADGSELCCTGTHLIMDADGTYIEAEKIKDGMKLSGGQIVSRVAVQTLPEKIPVYDMSVPHYLNFVLENGLIVHNSGKSFSAKREITNAFLLCPDDDILICDPEGEYTALVERLNGQILKLSPTGKGYDGEPCYINPMDLNLDYSDDDNPLSLKSDFILSLCELIVGGKDGLAPVEKTIIDRCVRIVYRDYLNDPKPENMPVLEDLYNALRAQDEKEAQYVATALEIYVTGSLNVFNHRTNVNINNRIVCYDIKELGKQLKKIGMLIVQDAVWNRVTINRAAHKTTRYYMDEFHLLLKEEQTASYSVEIWKRYRKWGGKQSAVVFCMRLWIYAVLIETEING
ncbi:MAG: PrgI family protein [Clostridia bacterium]|nr:PrgI family protein [Clostridia bacterium]